MIRRDFLKTLAILPVSQYFVKFDTENNMNITENNIKKIPVLFLGHGSPMNAIEDNEFVRGWKSIADTIAKPKAIVCISAHWETKGTYITAMDKPRTIHDFGGFPKELYEIEYPVPGEPKLAKDVQDDILPQKILFDDKWGLDHGSWSVLRRMYPDADIPVVQISLDINKSAKEHYDFAKQLLFLRQKGVLIVGSGNIVHNLRLLAWDKMNEQNFAFDWAIEANEKIKEFIVKEEFDKLINYEKQGKAFGLAVPTAEHFLPLLYTLGLKQKDENIRFFNDKYVAGSLSMTCLKIE